MIAIEFLLVIVSIYELITTKIGIVIMQIINTVIIHKGVSRIFHPNCTGTLSSLADLVDRDADALCTLALALT